MTRQRASSVRAWPASASRISWSRAPRRSGFEIVSRATPSAGWSRRSPLVIAQAPGSAGCAAIASLQHDERVTLGDRLPLLADDLLDLAGVLGLNGHLHLHRLEDHESVALVDLLPDLALDLPDRPRDVRLDVRQLEFPLVGFAMAAR